MIGISTDSTAQLSPELAHRLGVAVVPLTVTVDGVDHVEGVDIDADDFWGRYATGTPSVTTAAPGPGRFLVAWESLAEQGADEIVSIHIGSALSGTVNSARLAAGSAPIPVHVVDTGTASFSVALAAWAAADAARAGAAVADVIAAATAVASRCGNVFVVGDLTAARAGGRLASGTGDADGIPVLALLDGEMTTVGRAHDIESAVDTMVEHIRAVGGRIRVGVGSSDESSAPVAEGLLRALGAMETVEVVPYRISPSIGVHTGPGTAGLVYCGD